jgi:cardiolipin synthase (CMP-forming)
VSDWLDGYVAKRFCQESVLGSYLDPLADKAVIVCTVGALGWVEALSPAMVAILVGRDVLLVSGAFARRCDAIPSCTVPEAVVH